MTKSIRKRTDGMSNEKKCSQRDKNIKMHIKFLFVPHLAKREFTHSPHCVPMTFFYLSHSVPSDDIIDAFGNFSEICHPSANHCNVKKSFFDIRSFEIVEFFFLVLLKLIFLRILILQTYLTWPFSTISSSFTETP